MRVVVAFIATLVLPLPVVADAPACFPERTVLWKAELRDERARSFGVIRAGVNVRVLREGTGDRGEWSEIEVSAPAHVRGYVRTDALVVFTREKADLKTGWSWLLPETAVQITGVENGSAGIVAADPHKRGRRAPTAWLPCAALTGHPVGKLTRDDCHGAESDRFGPSPEGTPLDLEGSPVLTSLDGTATYTVKGVDSVFRRGTSERGVLVEVISWPDRRGYRGLLKPAALKRRVPCCSGFAWGHLCCEAHVTFDDPGEPARLMRDVHLKPFDDAELRVSIPSTEEVRIIARDPQRARVRVFLKGEDGLATAIFEGWVDADAVANDGERNDSTSP